MIAMLICRCPSAPTKAYKFLEERVENWTDVPIYSGRKQCNEFLEKFYDYPVTLTSPAELSKHIMKVSKYVVVVGWNDKEFTWADTANGGAQSSIDADLIVEQFA